MRIFSAEKCCRVALAARLESIEKPEEGSHQQLPKFDIECHLPVSPWLNQDIPDFAFAVRSTLNLEHSRRTAMRRFRVASVGIDARNGTFPSALGLSVTSSTIFVTPRRNPWAEAMRAPNAGIGQTSGPVLTLVDWGGRGGHGYGGGWGRHGYDGALTDVSTGFTALMACATAWAGAIRPLSLVGHRDAAAGAGPDLGPAA